MRPHRSDLHAATETITSQRSYVPSVPTGLPCHGSSVLEALSVPEPPHAWHSGVTGTQSSLNLGLPWASDRQVSPRSAVADGTHVPGRADGGVGGRQRSTAPGPVPSASTACPALSVCSHSHGATHVLSTPAGRHEVPQQHLGAPGSEGEDPWPCPGSLRSVLPRSPLSEELATSVAYRTAWSGPRAQQPCVLWPRCCLHPHSLRRLNPDRPPFCPQAHRVPSLPQGSRLSCPPARVPLGRSSQFSHRWA